MLQPSKQVTNKKKRASQNDLVKESSSFIRKQLEYLHLQFVSLMTSSVNAQLTKRPNLDIKTTIAGLERTLDMMCEVSVKSPQVFLDSFQPLRMPENARKAVEKCILNNKPSNFAYEIPHNLSFVDVACWYLLWMWSAYLQTPNKSLKLSHKVRILLQF